MMWYKAFSLWLGLKLGYNVLFQDVDLVWFKDPLDFFNSHRNQTLGKYTSYLSDDGQRSLRYTPFYANSGFFYMVSTPENVHFSYGIVIAFDSLQATGSHQNVFTSRLLENLDLTPSHRYFLDMLEFPSGVKFHHDKPYMEKIVTHQANPYMFHMCWTANKKQKLENFALSKMWYVSEACPLMRLIPPIGDLYTRIVEKIGGGHGDQTKRNFTPVDTFHLFDRLSKTCCTWEGLV
jgi:hypothetical protein